MGLPVSWVMLSVVFRVLTCLSMKLLDWGKCGEEVVWSMHCHCRNCMNSSDAKGGPLSVYMQLGGPYWDMSSWSFLEREWADSEVTLNRQGYFLNRSWMSRYSLPLWWKKSAAIFCNWPSGMSGQVGKPCFLCIWWNFWCYWQCQHWCQANKLPLLLVPASSPSPGVLHGGQQGYGQGVLGECDLVSFRRILASMDSSFQAPQKCWLILRTCLRQSGHPLRVKWYRVLYTGSCLMTPWMASSLPVDRCTCWMFWWMGIGRDSWRKGSNWGGQPAPHLYWVLYWRCSHIFECRVACTVDGLGLCEWAFAGSFPAVCGHFVWWHACCMCGTSQGQSTLTATLTQYLHNKSPCH